MDNDKTYPHLTDKAAIRLMHTNRLAELEAELDEARALADDLYHALLENAPVSPDISDDYALKPTPSGESAIENYEAANAKREVKE